MIFNISEETERVAVPETTCPLDSNATRLVDEFLNNFQGTQDNMGADVYAELREFVQNQIDRTT